MGAVISLNVNNKKLSFSLDKISKQVQSSLNKAMTKGMIRFMGQLQKKQYTGRPGLKVQTGLLRRSWRVWSFGTGGNFAVKLVNNVKYGKIHDKSRTGSGYRFPARTDVIGAYSDYGDELIMGEVSLSLAMLIDRGVVL